MEPRYHAEFIRDTLKDMDRLRRLKKLTPFTERVAKDVIRHAYERIIIEALAEAMEDWWE